MADSDTRTSLSNHSEAIDLVDFLDNGGDLDDLTLRPTTERDWAMMLGSDNKMDGDCDHDPADIPRHPREPSSTMAARLP